MRTAAWYAACMDSTDCLELLIAQRACLAKPSTGGYFPLYLAAQLNCVDSLQLLLSQGQGVDMDQVSDLGSTSVCAATCQNACDALRVLLEAKADENEP